MVILVSSCSDNEQVDSAYLPDREFGVVSLVHAQMARHDHLRPTPGRVLPDVRTSCDPLPRAVLRHQGAEGMGEVKGHLSVTGGRREGYPTTSQEEPPAGL